MTEPHEAACTFASALEDNSDYDVIVETAAGQRNLSAELRDVAGEVVRLRGALFAIHERTGCWLPSMPTCLERNLPPADRCTPCMALAALYATEDEGK